MAELTPVEQANQKLKTFLGKAVRRDGGAFAVISVEQDPNGQATTISGTVSVDSKDQAMVWNTQGKSFSQGTNLDLVVKVSIANF